MVSDSCDPMNCSLPGSSFHETLRARILGWVAISFSKSCSVVSNSLQPHGLFCPWNSPSQYTGVGSLSLLQGIFPTQGSNPGLPHYRWILYQLSHKESPRILEWVAYSFSSESSWPQELTWGLLHCRQILYQLNYQGSPILKEINPKYSLEGLTPKLKFQYFGPPDAKRWLIRKDPAAMKDWRQEEKGATEGEMVGQHHRFNEDEFEQTPGDGEGEGSLVCHSPWGRKELDMIE